MAKSGQATENPLLSLNLEYNRRFKAEEPQSIPIKSIEERFKISTEELGRITELVRIYDRNIQFLSLLLKNSATPNVNDIVVTVAYLIERNAALAEAGVQIENGIDGFTVSPEVDSVVEKLYNHFTELKLHSPNVNLTRANRDIFVLTALVEQLPNDLKLQQLLQTEQQFYTEYSQRKNPEVRGSCLIYTPESDEEAIRFFQEANIQVGKPKFKSPPTYKVVQQAKSGIADTSNNECAVTDGLGPCVAVDIRSSDGQVYMAHDDSSESFKEEIEAFVANHPDCKATLLSGQAFGYRTVAFDARNAILSHIESLNIPTVAIFRNYENFKSWTVYETNSGTYVTI